MSGSPIRGQALAGRAAGGDGRQALFGVAAMFLQVPRDQRLDGTPAASASRSPRATECSASGRALSQRPGLEGGDELARSIRPFWRASRPKSRSARGIDSLRHDDRLRARHLGSPSDSIRRKGGTCLRFYRRADRIALESSSDNTASFLTKLALLNLRSIPDREARTCIARQMTPISLLEYDNPACGRNLLSHSRINIPLACLRPGARGIALRVLSHPRPGHCRACFIPGCHKALNRYEMNLTIQQ